MCPKKKFEVESMLRWKLDDEESIVKTQSTVEELIGFVKEVHSITNDLKLGNPGLVFQVRVRSRVRVSVYVSVCVSVCVCVVLCGQTSHILGPTSPTHILSRVAHTHFVSTCIS